MFRFIIIIYITFLFFKKIYSVIQKLRENHISTNKHFFEVQIAQETYEKEQGLMFIKKKLKDNHGMLFIYDNNSTPSLWMKNTYIPLDAIFMDNNGQVTDLIENLKPKSTKSRKTEIPCKYVLEVNANTINNLDIKRGDYIGTNLLDSDLTTFDKNKLRNSLSNSKNNKPNKPNKKHKPNKPTKNRKNKTNT